MNFISTNIILHIDIILMLLKHILTQLYILNLKKFIFVKQLNSVMILGYEEFIILSFIRFNLFCGFYKNWYQNKTTIKREVVMDDYVSRMLIMAFLLCVQTTNLLLLLLPLLSVCECESSRKVC